jgi:cardiolipin synthase (CMP-forming)
MKVVWNVPNVLTVLRVLAAPVLAYFLMRGHYDYALYTFVLAAITDALDGFIARHFHQYTEFGAALDPLADKLITLTCLLILTFQGLVPLWLTLAMVVRDSVIVAGAFAYHHLFGEIDIHPTWLGKLHTLMAFSLFILVMAHQAHLIALADWLMPAFLAVLFSCLASMTQYVVLWARKAAQAAN